MIVGTHTAETAQDQINIVLRAGPDLDFSLKMKAERMRAGPDKGYKVLGCIEQIVFEVDRDCSIERLRSIGAHKTGRRLYWAERCPLIARTIPEEDLIFTQPIQLPLPDAPDPDDIVPNPYLVDSFGTSHLENINDLQKPRTFKQKLEKIASHTFDRFLEFAPIAQIIVLQNIKGSMQFGAMGSHRMPLSSLSGFDGRKLALLIDPYTGEAYFTGGRYQMPGPDLTV